jgi:hypothetical protein
MSTDHQVGAPSSTRAARVRGPIVTIAALSAAALALHLRDPHHSGSWGFCPLNAITGIYCPGCGGLRAVNDLSRGDIVAALSSNVLVVAAIPISIVLLLIWLQRAWSGLPALRLPARLSRVWWPTVAVVTLVFTVLRNTPAGSWLAP